MTLSCSPIGSLSEDETAELERLTEWAKSAAKNEFALQIEMMKVASKFPNLPKVIQNDGNRACLWTDDGALVGFTVPSP